jgi:hypothetical protein
VYVSLCLCVCVCVCYIFMYVHMCECMCVCMCVHVRVCFQHTVRVFVDTAVSVGASGVFGAKRILVAPIDTVDQLDAPASVMANTRN